MSFAYKNLTTPKNISSGVADFVLVAPVSDFATNGIKCPVAPFTDPGDEVKVKTAHQFKDGRAFAKFILAPEQNELNAKTLGDKGFQKLGLELKILIQGSYAEVHETIKNMTNTPLIVLSKDSNCSEKMWYQLGCDCEYAWATSEFATGTTKDGKKGYVVTISYNSDSILIYDEATAGAPSVLDEAAGSGSGS